MNDPSKMTDPDSSEDVVGNEPADFDLEINQEIIPDRENICDNSIDITSYESSGDRFYNTVDIDTDECRRSAESALTPNISRKSRGSDLINFDSPAVDTGGHTYSNGISNNDYELNDTFGGEVPIVNKHLKVKTGDLLRVSGIGSRLSESPVVSPQTDVFKSESVTHDDEIFHSADSLRVENTDDILPTTSIKSEPLNFDEIQESFEDLSNETFNRTTPLETNQNSDENKNLTLKTDKFEEDCIVQQVVENNNITFAKIHKHNNNNTVNQEDIAENHNSTFECIPEKVQKDIVIKKEVKSQLTPEAVFDKPQESNNSANLETDKNLRLTEEPEDNTNNLKQEVDVANSSIPETDTKKSLEDSASLIVIQGQESCPVAERNCNNITITESDIIKNGSYEESEISPVKSIDITVDGNLEEVDLTKEDIDFEQLSPESPKSRVKQEHIIKEINSSTDTKPQTSDVFTGLEESLKRLSLEEKFAKECSNQDIKKVTKAGDCKQDLTSNSESEDLDKTLLENNYQPPYKMTDMVEKLNQQQAEISDLKLKLNAAQQHNASLELQIRQNEEVVIKAQAETLRTEQNYQQEVKQLKEKLNENSKIIEKDRIRELEEQVKEGKARETRLLAELSQKTKDDVNYQKIMDQFENNIKSRLAEIKKLNEENETTRTHLLNLEAAFSDVHLKYEKTKASLQGFKANEEALLTELEVRQKSNIQHEERYESLKAYARTQIEKSNKEIHAMKEHHESEVSKLKALIRRLEIKVSSLEVSLQQKTEECEQLSALCDEVTGKKV